MDFDFPRLTTVYLKVKRYFYQVQDVDRKKIV